MNRRTGVGNGLPPEIEVRLGTFTLGLDVLSDDCAEREEAECPPPTSRAGVCFLAVDSFFVAESGMVTTLRAICSASSSAGSFGLEMRSGVATDGSFNVAGSSAMDVGRDALLDWLVAVRDRWMRFCVARFPIRCWSA